MKLITWNIQWGRGADGRVDLDRIVDDARRIADFDLLCLQEVGAGFPQLPGSDGSDQFAALAEKLPGHEMVAGWATDVPRAGGGRARFGNAVLSRLPVRQVFRHLLPWPADDGVRSMQRIAVEAVVEAPFDLLRVTTTHLEYHSARQRSAQVERLRELHREAVQQSRSRRPDVDDADAPFAALPRPTASVLVGDFNLRPEDPGRARLAAPFDDPDVPPLRDAWDLVHRGRPHDPTVGVHDKLQWPGPPFACDFVFVGADIADRVADVRVDATTAASDHQPVLVVFA